jgi:hypothetical protein
LATVSARSAGVAAADCLRMQELIQDHEHPVGSTTTKEAKLLGDADALSFFALNSRGFSDYYGPEHTRKKVSYSLSRMSARALEYLGRVKLSPDIRQYVREASCAGGRALGPELVP